MSEPTPPPPEQQPSPQQPFGQAPGGAESLGSSPPPPPGGPPPTEPTARKRNPLPLIILIILGVVVLICVAVVGVGVWIASRDAPTADVGQCLAGTTPSELDAEKLKIVDCSAADAGFKVVQRVEGKNYAESDGACTDTATEFVFWSGKDKAKAGTTLCLARVTK